VKSVTQPDESTRRLVSEMSAFLLATAKALHETVSRFEVTTARITERVMAQPTQADRDLIVMLQDFDRLQQEFAALAELFIRATAKSEEAWLDEDGDSHPAREAIATVSLAELKDRLTRHLGILRIDMGVAPMEEEVVF
jgi:biopolymer transport protein ExbB/TolQ